MKALAVVAAFLVAMWALAAGWTALRQTWRTPTPAGIVDTLVYAAVFTASFLYLGFWVYAWDRAAGRVKRSIALYEWFLRNRGERRD